MGHYRSEMGYEEQDRRDAERKEKRRKALVKAISADIKKRNIATVLADIVTDAQDYRLRNSSFD